MKLMFLPVWLCNSETLARIWAQLPDHV